MIIKNWWWNLKLFFCWLFSELYYNFFYTLSHWAGVNLQILPRFRSRSTSTDSASITSENLLLLASDASHYRCYNSSIATTCSLQSHLPSERRIHSIDDKCHKHFASISHNITARRAQVTCLTWLACTLYTLHLSSLLLAKVSRISVCAVWKCHHSLRSSSFLLSAMARWKFHCEMWKIYSKKKSETYENAKKTYLTAAKEASRAPLNLTRKWLKRTTNLTYFLFYSGDHRSAYSLHPPHHHRALLREKANRAEKFWHSPKKRRFLVGAKREFEFFSQHASSEISEAERRRARRREKFVMSWLFLVDVFFIRLVYHTQEKFVYSHCSRANSVVAWEKRKNLNVHDEKAILIAWESMMIMRICMEKSR